MTSNNSIINEIDETTALLMDWKKRVRESHYSHYETAKFYGRLNLYLGIPVLILTALLGTSFFATLGDTSSEEMQLFLGGLSVIAAVLAALQTFFGFSEKSEKHRAAGARYGALRREIEQCCVSNQSDLSPRIDSVRVNYDTLAQEAPNIPSRIWKNRKNAHQEGSR